MDGHDTDLPPRAAKSCWLQPIGSGGEPTAGRSGQPPIVNPNIPSAREKLGTDDSAGVRAQLIQEIETLPDDDLQPRAIAILKAKNRLSADDAKRVEVAFAARMALQRASREALTADEPASVPTDPCQSLQPPASTDAAKPVRTRGRPKKVKAAAEQSAAPPVPSKPTIDFNPPASRHLQADAALAKIQKWELTISEPRRHRDKAHLKFIASQPCLVCGRSPTDAHHPCKTCPLKDARFKLDTARQELRAGVDIVQVKRSAREEAKAVEAAAAAPTFKECAEKYIEDNHAN